MYRFFVDKESIEGNLVILDKKDSRHITSVLRMRVGQEIELVADRMVYLSRIVEADKNNLQAEIISKREGLNEPSVYIRLYQGLARTNKMELVLEKGTELGISEFIPLAMKRSVAKIEKGKKEEGRLERWREIIEASAKQSKRDIIPELKPVHTFKEALEDLKYESNIIVAYEEEEDYVKDFLGSMEGRINIIIGPEGGFDPDEIEELKKLDAKIISLGKRILRTETAGPFLAGLIIYELE